MTAAGTSGGNDRNPAGAGRHGRIRRGGGRGWRVDRGVGLGGLRSRMRVLAVDFGTSNTVAALGVDGGAPRLVTIDGSPLVPSSVYLADDGTLAVGRDADRQARLDPSRYEPNPKRRIDDGFVLLGATPLPVTTVIAQVLQPVVGEARPQLGG